MKFYIKIAIFLFTGMLSDQCLHAQDLAVIYDKDGYSNVRKSASAKSPIIGKIKEGQVFSISPFNDDFKIKNWIAVWFPIKPQTNIKDFIKSEDTNEGGFIYSNRITMLSDLKEVEAQLTTAEKIVFKNEEFEISLETKAYPNKKGTKGDLAIKRGFAGWGSYNRMPKSEFKSVRLKTIAGIYQFPKSALSRLYEINLDLTKVYIGKNKEIYIATTNSDGSESYNAIWCLKNNKLFSMTVMQTIP